MSEFSGKCDLWDWFSMSKKDIDFSKIKIYVGGNIVPLRIESKKDLLPYAPFIVAVGCHDGENDVIRLSQKSFVDQEEEEHLQFRLDDILRIYRRCKRKKEPFSKDIEEFAHGFYNSPETAEIIDRVVTLGEKATIKGIHCKYSDYYRKNLYEAMVEEGWDRNRAKRWCYGIERAWNDNTI